MRETATTAGQVFSGQAHSSVTLGGGGRGPTNGQWAEVYANIHIVEAEEGGSVDDGQNPFGKLLDSDKLA